MLTVLTLFLNSVGVAFRVLSYALKLTFGFRRAQTSF